MNICIYIFSRNNMKTMNTIFTLNIINKNVINIYSV